MIVVITAVQPYLTENTPEEQDRESWQFVIRFF
jgi:hypothetical protein